MSELRMGAIESRFADMIWENEPVPSPELVKLAERELNWKKSTTYTTMKKLCGRGFTENQNSVVRALVPKEAVQSFESDRFVARAFDGSLPCFLAAFLGGKTISEAEAEELKRLIDAHREV